MSGNALVCLVTFQQPSSVLPSNKDLFPDQEARVKKEKKRRYARRIPSGCIAASCSDLTLSGCSPDVSPPVRIVRRWSVAMTSRPKQRRSACLCNAKRVTARHSRKELAFLHYANFADRPRIRARSYEIVTVDLDHLHYNNESAISILCQQNSLTISRYNRKIYLKYYII